MSISRNEGLPAGLAGAAAFGSHRTAGKIPRTRKIRNVFAFIFLGMMLFMGVAQADAGGQSARLDLNRATADQLQTLPGIGAVKAAAILAVRETRGGFESMEELEAVRGIGPALVAKLRPLVVLGTKGTKRGKTAHK